MFFWQPGKWIQYAGLVVLPFAGASFLTTGGLQDDISKNAMKAASGDWAKVQLDGRDATITGTAPDEAAKNAAVAALASTYGLRSVNADGLKVAPKAADVAKIEPPRVETQKVEVPKVEVPKVEPLAAPTVAAVTTDAAGALITGTWPEGKAKTLDVIVNNLDYSLGKSPELTSTGGNWVLKLAAGALAAGSYAVAAKASDGVNPPVMAAADQIPALVVAPPPPEPPKVEALAAPTITSATADASGAMITGTWPEGKAKTLDVIVNDIDYSLGKNPELTSANGNWTLKLGTAALPAGAYSLMAKVGDGDKQSVMAAPDGLPKLVVAAPEPPKPEPLPAPTIASAKSDTTGAIITGTWPEGKAKTLDVIVNDTHYSLGKNPELTSSDGNWTLKLGAAALPAGDYNLSAKVGDGVTQSVMAATDGLPKLVVAAPEPPKPDPLAPPVVGSVTTDDKGTVVTGTWAEGKAKTLEIGVDSKIYKLGSAAELLTSNGVWTLTIPPLVAGKHNVGAVEGDGQQNVATGKATMVEVAAPPPPPPKPPAPATVENVAATVDRPTVFGTWPVGDGIIYQLELDGVTHTLGKDNDLLGTPDGKWKLVPTKPLVNGTYDVVMKVTGADGQVTSTVAKGAVVINVPPPPPPPPTPAAYDCVAALSSVAAAFPIRFEFDHDDLGADFVEKLSNYGSILKDGRCATIKMQVTGHSDFIGSDEYNMDLSGRRATTVVDLLERAGIDGSRLSKAAAGKTKPLDPANSNDARAKNRRVEFTAQ